jgi:hypothetical protein
MPVTQQTVDALDVVFDARGAGQGPTQFRQCQASPAHCAARRDLSAVRRESAGAAFARTLSDNERMHGAVSFEGCEPRKRR